LIATAKEIYVATRKKHDLLFNLYVMRPIAAPVVVVLAKTPVTPNQVTLLSLLVFVAAAAVLVVMPTYLGGVVGVAVLEASYCLDCADGMLARFKKIASKEGHLFDFFADELKAVLLVGALGVRLWRTGGWGIDASAWPPSDARFLVGAIAGTIVLSSAISLTNFVRRPELSGRETTVEAHYETVEEKKPTSTVGRLGQLVTTFLRFLNHYPSHIWIFALVDRLDVLWWTWMALNLMYLGRGWLGLFLRFGRPARG
jgi:hypothetical protein